MFIENEKLGAFNYCSSLSLLSNVKRFFISPADNCRDRYRIREMGIHGQQKFVFLLMLFLRYPVASLWWKNWNLPSPQEKVDIILYDLFQKILILGISSELDCFHGMRKPDSPPQLTLRCEIERETFFILRGASNKYVMEPLYCRSIYLRIVKHLFPFQQKYRY